MTMHMHTDPAPAEGTPIPSTLGAPGPHGAPAPQSAPAPRNRVGAIITLIVGSILVVFGPALGLTIGGLSLIPTALDFAGQVERVHPSTPIEIPAGGEILLLAPEKAVASIDPSACAVTGDAATAAVAEAPRTSLNTLVNGTNYVSFAQVSSEQGGSVRIDCATTADVLTAPPFPVGSVLGPLGWWTLAGVGLSVVGIVLVIVGIVRLVRAPSATSAAAPAPAPAAH
ncbi:hypothetical protein JD292_07055 [Leucobacter sp. CSA2]|uniref:Uncharacterized protein n=1 Tax=Leucobacter edaphi TaxID=2796472 RepID=A0A934QBY0_9MICO|nr:hypothetical protein [Leucobacter edaphi]MBK0421829.1 hypothetical protein [Leucobacter edaphi]